MTGGWNAYVELLQELSGLDEVRARGVADAGTAYDIEARRLQNELSAADRELGSLKQRSARLQVGVRDVARGLDVAMPSPLEQPSLSLAGLRDALTSAEYDLQQLRASADYLRRRAPAAAPGPSPDLAHSPPPPVSTGPAPAPASSGISLLVVLVGLGIGVALLVAVLLVAMS